MSWQHVLKLRAFIALLPEKLTTWTQKAPMHRRTVFNAMHCDIYWHWQLRDLSRFIHSDFIEVLYSIGTPFTDTCSWKFRGPFSVRPPPRTTSRPRTFKCHRGSSRPRTCSRGRPSLDVTNVYPFTAIFTVHELQSVITRTVGLTLNIVN